MGKTSALGHTNSSIPWYFAIITFLTQYRLGLAARLDNSHTTDSSVDSHYYNFFQNSLLTQILYYCLPVFVALNVIETMVTWYALLVKERNKNLALWSHAILSLLNTSAMVTAVLLIYISSPLGVSVAPWLFIGALGASSIYSLSLVITHLIQLHFTEDPHQRAIHWAYIREHGAAVVINGLALSSMIILTLIAMSIIGGGPIGVGAVVTVGTVFLIASKLAFITTALVGLLLAYRAVKFGLDIKAEKQIASDVVEFHAIEPKITAKASFVYSRPLSPRVNAPSQIPKKVTVAPGKDLPLPTNHFEQKPGLLFFQRKNRAQYVFKILDNGCISINATENMQGVENYLRAEIAAIRNAYGRKAMPQEVTSHLARLESNINTRTLSEGQSNANGCQSFYRNVSDIEDLDRAVRVYVRWRQTDGGRVSLVAEYSGAAAPPPHPLGFHQPPHYPQPSYYSGQGSSVPSTSFDPSAPPANPVGGEPNEEAYTM